MTGQFLVRGRVLPQFCCTIFINRHNQNKQHTKPSARVYTQSANLAAICRLGSSTDQTRTGPAVLPFWISLRMSKTGKWQWKGVTALHHSLGPHTSCSWSSNSSVTGCGVRGSDNLKPDKRFFFFFASKHLKPQTPDRSYSPHISGPRIHARAPAVDGWGAGKKLISSSIRRDAENTILSSGLSVEESDKFCLTFNRHKDERGVVSSGETHSTAAGMGCPCRQRCTYPEATCGWRRQKCVAHCLCGRLLELCIMQHRATKIM